MIVRRTKSQFFFFIFISILISSSFISAQNIKPTFTHLTIKDGLSQSTVEAILQDKTGFMWFATNDGLNKYDGYDFTTFRYESSDTNSISDNYVYGICEDDSGFIWVATNNGLNKFDPVYNKFTRFLNSADDPNSLSSNLVQAILKDKNNNIWAGTLGGGLNVLGHSSRKFYHLKQNNIDEKLSGFNMITSLCEDRAGNIWAGTYNGNVAKIIIKAGNIIRPDFLNYTFSTGQNEVNENIVWDIKQDKNGKIWIATNRTGAIKLNPDNGSFIIYDEGQNKLNDLSVRRIFIDEDSTIYFGTKTGGLNVLNPEGTFTYIKANESSGSLNDNSIWSIYKERKGALWIGTEFGGVNKFDPLSTKFDLFQSYSKNLRKQRVLSFYEKENNLFLIGTDGGLILFDYKINHFANISGTEILENETVTAILEENNIIWIGTNGSGLFKVRLAKNGKNISSISKEDQYRSINKSAFSNNKIKVMFKSKTGYFWIGTYGGGVDLFNPENGKIIYNLSEKGIKEKFIYALLEDENYLWIGTYGDGLLRYNILSGEIKKIIHQPGNLKSLSNDRIYSLFLDHDKNLWIGTAGGLNKFNSRDESFMPLTSNEGIANDVIYSILEDDEGFIWVSTNKGISRFNTETKTFKNFSLKDGLQDYEFNRGAALKSLDGKLIFGGINGFNIFKPKEITQNIYIPPVVITSFKKMNREIIFPKAISEIDTIILSYDENFFSFTFAALDFTNPEINSYAYKMDGFNKEWVISGNDRTATYTNLSPGSYIFKVKGSNNDGVWNETGAKIAIIITPPFWMTWWAYLIYAILFLGGLYLIRATEIRRREKKEEERLRREREAALLREAKLKTITIEQEKELEKQKIRNRIAQDLHDEIGSNLSSISLMSDLIQKSEKTDAESINKIKRIHKVAKDSSQAMRDIVWITNPTSDNLKDLITKMNEVANDLLAGINWKFDFPEKTTKINLLPETKRNVFLIFKEALNNIVKHSEAKNAVVRLKISEENLLLAIKDNGKGFNTYSGSSGNGLKNMENRAKEINGILKLKSDPGKGSTIVLAVNITQVRD